MRSILRVGLTCAIVVLCVAGCSLFGPQFSTDAVSGTIAGNSFTFASGYAGPSSTDATVWIVYLFPVAPATGADPWDTGAYSDPYEYVDFSFKANLVPGEFEVSRYSGIGDDENIGINGWLSFVDSIVFDSGTLIIDVFDNTASGKVSGRILADTNDGSSKINGTFEVSVDPTSL